MSAIVVIPARFASTRFPGKPLAPLKGIPVIQHVYEKCRKASSADDVIVATDNEEILNRVVSFGGKAVLTSSDHASGTDRIAEAVRGLGYDIIVNVQGDEPLIRPEMIDAVISLLDDRRASIGTLAKRIEDPAEIFDPNVVKTVFDEDGFALYFSRAPIPFYRDFFRAEVPKGSIAEAQALYTATDNLPPGTSELIMYKHIGIYSYRRQVLGELTALPPSRLERCEKLEQLRALEHNYRIKVEETPFETRGVDTPEDLERIEKCLSSSS